MNIQQVRNATIIVEYGGKKILVDPMLGCLLYTSGRNYDFFRDRVMFPFYDVSGRVVASLRY